ELLLMNDLYNTIKEAEFVFIKSGNCFIIDKDSYNALYPFVALAERDIKMFLLSNYKTIVINMKGEVIMKNFGGDIGKKTYDLTSVKQVLSEVEESYNSKQKLLEDIDKA